MSVLALTLHMVFARTSAGTIVLNFASVQSSGNNLLIGALGVMKES